MNKEKKKNILPRVLHITLVGYVLTVVVFGILGYYWIALILLSPLLLLMLVIS